MRNIRLFIAYDGTDFHGWQRQPNALTVQECLETAAEKILGERTHLYASGRTDAGVHALKQVANFKTDCPIPCDNLVKALNDALPPSVRIQESHEVSARFHARYDVRAKTYRYRILQAQVCSPFLWRFVCHYPFPLDAGRMMKAARLLEGEHDFTSFAAADGSGAATPGGAPAGLPEGSQIESAHHLPVAKVAGDMVRRVFASRILRRPRASMVVYEVSGSGFLHHMVRNIAGTLIEVGRGKLEPEAIPVILEARDRNMAGPTAPAQGLCLVDVEY